MSVDTKKFKALESDFGTTIAVDIWDRIREVSDYVEKSYPIGMILFFHATQAGLVEAPDSKYWQELDGSTVSNASSPLNGVTLPDLRNKFVRHPLTGEPVPSSSGSDSMSYIHNHGGTGVTDAGNPASFVIRGGINSKELRLHSHDISTLVINLSTVPPYRALKAYIRIA